MKFNAAFWKWFGDSKVVDARGDPLVVYHGTRANFFTFDPSKRGEASSSWAKEFVKNAGFFFVADSDAAALYAERATGSGKPRVISAFLKIDNPFVWDYESVDACDISPGPVLKSLSRAMKEIRSRGHDGVIWENVDDRGGPLTQYIAFSPTQIKSATGNDGTWDADDPDIRSNPANETMLVSIDDIPKSTQSDIFYELEDRFGVIDADQIKSMMLDLVNPPMVVLWTPNPSKMKSQFQKTRKVSRAGVKPLLALLERGAELDPILTADGKFLEGGHRVTAYVEAGRDSIPAIDIGHFLRMNLMDWHDGILTDESLLKEAQKVANKLR